MLKKKLSLIFTSSKKDCCFILLFVHFAILLFQERIVPPDPITLNEKTQTLRRLNQIIEHRLVTSELPPLMRKLKIGKGSEGRAILT